MNGASPVARVTAEIRASLHAEEAGETDPRFIDVWELMSDLTNSGGARLLEPRFAETEGAEEAYLYLQHFERVARVGRFAPVRVPAATSTHLRVLGRLVDDTKDMNVVLSTLLAVPRVSAEMSGYVERSLGMCAKPLMDVFELHARAGALFTACIKRCTPMLSEDEL